MVWRGREAAARGKEKKRLGALAAAVVTLREGLRPHNTDQYAEAAALLGSTGDGAAASGRNVEFPLGSGDPGNSDSIASDAQANSEAGSLGGNGGGVGWDDGERGLALRREGLEQLLGPASGGLSDRQAAQLAARRSALMLSPEGTAITARKVNNTAAPICCSQWPLSSFAHGISEHHSTDMPTRIVGLRTVCQSSCYRLM